MTAAAVLLLIALLLALLSLFPTTANWPLLSVSVLLVCAAGLIPVFAR